MMLKNIFTFALMLLFMSKIEAFEINQVDSFQTEIGQCHDEKNDNQRTGIRSYFLLMVDNRNGKDAESFDLTKVNVKYRNEDFKINSQKIFSTNPTGFLKGFDEKTVIQPGKIVFGVVWLDYHAKDYSNKICRDAVLSYNGIIIEPYESDSFMGIEDGVKGMPIVFYAAPPKGAIVMEGYIGATGEDYREICNMPINPIYDSNLCINVLSYFYERSKTAPVAVYIVICVTPDTALKNEFIRKGKVDQGICSPFISKLKLQVNSEIYEAYSPVRLAVDKETVLRGFGEPALLFVNKRMFEYGVLKFSIPQLAAFDLPSATINYGLQKFKLNSLIKRKDVNYLLPAGVYGEKEISR